MPPQSRELVEAMACLGGRAELSLLQTATAESAGVVEQRLAPALDEGLLVAEPGAHQAVRFRHDRIREVVLGGLGPRRRRALQLAMARRLAAVPELFAVAAEQYLPVAGAIEDTAERRAVAGLLRRAAGQATLTGDYSLVNELLAAALPLIDPGETAALAEVHTARHTALFSLGRLEEADEEYRAIEGLCSTALLRAEATAVQVRSLTHRKRLAEAVDLGLETLRALGRIVPSAVRLPAEIDRHFDHLHRWLEDADAAGDQARPGITDPALLATARIVNAVVATAYFAADPAMQAWLSLEALRIWIEHGPGPALAGPAGHSAVAVVALRGDYAAGYRTARRILAVAETRGYEPGTSQMRQLFANFCCWFEPIENGVQAARQARAGLIADGDLANAGYAYSIATYFLADCAPTLETFLAEVDAGLAFARRTGNEQTGQWFEGYRWLAGVLRGEGSAAADEAIAADRYAANPAALFYAHLSRAQAAAIFGDLAALTRHTAAAMPLRPGPPRQLLRPPWPACCAGWPWPGRPAPPTVASAAACCPNWTR